MDWDEPYDLDFTVLQHVCYRRPNLEEFINIFAISAHLVTANNVSELDKIHRLVKAML